MRILFVNHSPDVSGAERSLLETALGLIEAGHAVAIACPRGRLARLAEDRSVSVLDLEAFELSFRRDSRMLLKASLSLGRGVIGLRRSVRAWKPDIVHANSVRAGLMAGPALMGISTPLIVHVRDRLPASAAGRLAGSAASLRASAVLANSAFTAAALPARAQARLHVIDNPVDVDRFRPGDAPSEASPGGDDGPVLAVVGQITPWKRQHLAIETLARLVPTHPRARLVIAGDAVFTSSSTRLDNTAYRDSLHALASALSVHDRVTFLGTTESVEEVMAAADVVLVPSENEPFGRVIVEAMLCGTPVVASMSGGPQELINDGVTGIFAASDEPDDWAAAVESLCSDDRHRVAISTAAREFAENRFSREQVTRATLDVYDAVLG